MTLDPKNWTVFRQVAHAMLDSSLDKMENSRQGRVWTPVPKNLKAKLKTDVPNKGSTPQQIKEELDQILEYGPGNTHPRFFGWVNGAGSPSNILAEIAAASMNVNSGGRNHIAPIIEQQVIKWSANIMGMPNSTTGLVTSGTSMATIIALKVARDRALELHDNSTLVGYTSEQTHNCIAKAFDLLGIPVSALRKVPCDSNFEIDIKKLEQTIEKDISNNLHPFTLIGNAGTVNTGSIDNLDKLADIAHKNDIWYHIDGAFGSAAILSKTAQHRLKGLGRADSIAFDFHKWWQVNYEAGCVLIKDHILHKKSFANRPEYLKYYEEGLAGGDFWAMDYGPELSRSFRALKVWVHLKSHGIAQISNVVENNISQARYLKSRIEAENVLELLAPVPLNICCFRYKFQSNIDTNNSLIVLKIQESGIAAPSTTVIDGSTAIRVNITNHRTTVSDLDLLVNSVLKTGRSLV
ncbi:MAG: aminotransferase class I/II-fold pyridoxal phosphate-dependent enzyme [Hellea sp.]|nr:aminotransferase class I/II-fold pyridoxal phosphate-dependent enzyme [Hellea sp.]